MRALQKFLQEAQLVHHLQGRGMHRVAAKAAQEILVLLEHDGIDPGARRQEAQDHAGRTTTDDAASRPDGFCRRHRHRPTSFGYALSLSRLTKTLGMTPD